MIKLFITLTSLVLSNLAFPNSIEKELIESQKEVIRLQKEILLNQKKLAKRYDLRSLCFESEEQCSHFSAVIKAISNSSVYTEAVCLKEKNREIESNCYKNDWVLNSKVQILE